MTTKDSKDNELPENPKKPCKKKKVSKKTTKKDTPGIPIDEENVLDILSEHIIEQEHYNDKVQQEKWLDKIYHHQHKKDVDIERELRACEAYLEQFLDDFVIFGHHNNGRKIELIHAYSEKDFDALAEAVKISTINMLKDG